MCSDCSVIALLLLWMVSLWDYLIQEAIMGCPSAARVYSMTYFWRWRRKVEGFLGLTEIVKFAGLGHERKQRKAVVDAGRTWYLWNGVWTLLWVLGRIEKRNNARSLMSELNIDYCRLHCRIWTPSFHICAPLTCGLWNLDIFCLRDTNCLLFWWIKVSEKSKSCQQYTILWGD
jgi:hypothetical protein